MKFPNLQNNVRNPLGVIAMFVSFAYVSMVVSFTIGIDKLNGASERLPIIWFLILFPLIIFIAFILLIIFCNEKLFGPLDYRDDSSFILMNRHEIETKAEDKVRETNKIIKTSNANKSNNSTFLLYSNPVYSTIQHNVVAKLSGQIGVFFNENVKTRYENKLVIFDAVGQSEDTNYYVECKCLPSEPSDNWYSCLNRKFRLYTRILDNENTRYKFILAIVAEKNVNRDSVKERLKNDVIDIRWFDREMIISDEQWSKVNDKE